MIRKIISIITIKSVPTQPNHPNLTNHTMHVKIVGFKCHLDASYDFENDTMVLLKGVSGAGKSTVLQAIFWALYGSMRGIYNNSGQMKKCSVTLQINQLIIYRQKRPELLRVTIVPLPNPNPTTQPTQSPQPERTYVDTVAQKIIDQAFGSKTLWKSCSYVTQKERCSLLSGSAADRLTLLNQLSFDQDNPKEYIIRIDQELKEINKKFIETQAVFTTELKLYTDQLALRPITVTLNDQDIKTLDLSITNLQSESQKLYNEVLSHERNIGSYNMITTQIKQGEIKLSRLVEMDNITNGIPYTTENYNTDISNLTNQLSNTKEQLSIVSKYNNLKNQINNIQSQIDNYQSQKTKLDNDINGISIGTNTIKTTLSEFGYNFTNPIPATSQMVWETQQKETSRTQYINQCQNLGIEYDQNTSQTITQTVNRLQEEILSAQTINHQINTYNQLKGLEQQLDILDTNQTLLNPGHISELETSKHKIAIEISELQKGLELLQCPECSKSLRYVGGGLVPGGRDPVDPIQITRKQTEYQNLTNKIVTIRSGINILTQISNARKQLEGVDMDKIINITNPSNISNHNNLISQLTRIQIVPEPKYSSEYLGLIVDYNTKVSSLTNLRSQRDSIQTNITNLFNQLNSIKLPNVPSLDITNLNNEINKLNTSINQLHSKHQNSQIQIATRTQLVNNINNLKTQQSTIEASLNPTIKTVYETTNQLLEQNKTKHSEALYSQSMVTKQVNLTTNRQEVINTQEDLVGLERLKQNAINVECKQLQDTVDIINHSLEEVLPLFFNEPIKMTLQLYKILKTKKQVKPGLNIVIKYGSVEYDNINLLSGGEGDRISLGLVLALNQVSNSPVVLLDECISSLDGVMKETCITAMKEMSGKTIICVDHEAVEGYYDKTIIVAH